MKGWVAEAYLINTIWTELLQNLMGILEKTLGFKCYNSIVKQNSSRSSWLFSERLFVRATPGYRCFTVTATFHSFTRESQIRFYRFKKMMIAKTLFHAGIKNHLCHIQRCITKLSHRGLPGHALLEQAGVQGLWHRFWVPKKTPDHPSLNWKPITSRTLTNYASQTWDWNSSPGFASGPLPRSKNISCPVQSEFNLSPASFGGQRLVILLGKRHFHN